MGIAYAGLFNFGKFSAIADLAVKAPKQLTSNRFYGSNFSQVD